MLIPKSLTPLSQSVLHVASEAAHRRHARTLALEPGPTIRTVSPAFLWDDRPLAALTVAAWGQSPQTIGHLFAVDAPSSSPNKVKINRTIKQAQKYLGESAENRRKLIAWSDSVFALSWSQAELLQVMEEIEPFVTEALYDVERLAAIAVGGYARLVAVLNQRFRAAPLALALNLVAGLETPDSVMVSDLRQGVAQATWLARHGHRADQELELAAPRLSESPALFPASTRSSVAWDPAAAAQRRQQALREAVAGVGLLQRSGLRTLVELVQKALVAHAEARDALARVLAASRRWSLAAANEGMADKRLAESSEIFLLELEEVKQLMTGEWHSRAQVQPRLEARRQKPSLDARRRGRGVGPIGIAGDAQSGRAFHLNAASAIPDVPIHAFALALETTPAWAPLFLKIDGVATERGDWLCHTATVARAGGLPTVVAAPELSAYLGQRIQLQPAKNQLRLAN